MNINDLNYYFNVLNKILNTLFEPVKFKAMNDVKKIGKVKIPFCIWMDGKMQDLLKDHVEVLDIIEDVEGYVNVLCFCESFDEHVVGKKVNEYSITLSRGIQESRYTSWGDNYVQYEPNGSFQISGIKKIEKK